MDMDEMLGQGTNTLFLITANEPLAMLEGADVAPTHRRGPAGFAPGEVDGSREDMPSPSVWPRSSLFALSPTIGRMTTTMSEKPEFVTESLTFTSEQVVRLAGITPRKLAYWVDTGVVTASVDRAKSRGRVRLFSFTDLVEIKVAAWLRDLISLQLIRKVVDRLKTMQGLDAPLGAVRFGVVEFRSGDQVTGYEVVLQMHDGRWESASRGGQLVLELFIPVGELSEALRAEVHELRSRRDRVGKIERRRGVLGSTPVIAGTRVPTKAIWNLHRSGSSDEEIVESYPGLDVADVRAAISTERRRRKVSA